MWMSELQLKNPKDEIIDEIISAINRTSRPNQPTYPKYRNPKKRIYKRTKLGLQIKIVI